MSSSYRETLDRWLSKLDVKANTVIDIGGSQVPVSKRVASWDVKNYYIADLADPHERSPLPDIVIDLNGHAETSKKADVIFCLEVFEYVYDPMNAFHIIAKLLKPKGHAWVSFPFVYPQHNPIHADSLRYTISGIENLAYASGMVVAQCLMRRPESSLLSQFYGAERMRAAKGVDHNVMGWIVKLEKL